MPPPPDPLSSSTSRKPKGPPPANPATPPLPPNHQHLGPAPERSDHHLDLRLRSHPAAHLSGPKEQRRNSDPGRTLRLRRRGQPDSEVHGAHTRYGPEAPGRVAARIRREDGPHRQPGDGLIHRGARERAEHEDGANLWRTNLACFYPHIFSRAKTTNVTSAIVLAWSCMCTTSTINTLTRIDTNNNGMPVVSWRFTG